MKMIHMTRWLLVAMLLSGCTGLVESQIIATSTPVAPVTSTAQPAPTSTPTVIAPTATPAPSATPTLVPPTVTPTATRWSTEPHPLQIEVMRQQSYPGSAITFEQTLASGSNYDQYVVSYLSDGYKINALMTIPDGEKPEGGWPVIVFLHGYIPPSQYRTTERYIAYVDAIARNGYIVFKTDLRGHGSSEGAESMPNVVYGIPAYTVDVLNAVASLQAYEDADADRVGLWGHSMGGQLIIRAMVVAQDIKAGVIWAGDLAPYPDVVEAYWGRNGQLSSWTQEQFAKYGSVEENPAFWDSISPDAYLADLSGPLELHHGTADADVSIAWSEALFETCQSQNPGACELYTYAGDNHNISTNFGTAMQRSVAFFDRYVKGE